MRAIDTLPRRPLRRWPKTLAAIAAASLLGVALGTRASAATIEPIFAAPQAFTGVVDAGGLNGPSTISSDLNGDGIDDLVTAATVTVSSGSLADVVVTQLGLGSGAFAAPVQSVVRPEQAGNLVSALATGDVNRDGRLDIVLGFTMRFFSLSTDNLAVLPGRGDGSFGAAILSASGANTPLIPQTLVGDVTGDGVPDALLLEQTGTTDFSGMQLMVEAGAGDGTFTLLQRVFRDTNPVHAALADVTAGGRPDVVVTGSGGSNGGSSGLFVFPGQAGGVFGNAVHFFHGSGGLAVVDFNGDGLPDIAVSENGADIYVNAPGGITPESPGRYCNRDRHQVGPPVA